MYEKRGIKFSNKEHYKRFMQLNALAFRTTVDEEYSPCLYILSSSEAIYEKTKSCISRNGIKGDSIIRKSYSTSEKYLVKIAIALFNSINTLKLDFYWVVKFDAGQYEVILEAFRMRRK